MKVDLEKNSYEIIITDTFSKLRTYLRETLRGSKICIVTEEAIAGYYLEQVRKEAEKAGFSVSICLIEGGEHHKNLQTVQKIYQILLEKGFDRKGAVIALGGGIVGDIAGFAAATYMRGIDFVQVPTTLLAQVDSSVGGKVGVNFLDTKNMVGNFYQPRFVYINTKTLLTLTDSDYRSGLGEVVKYAVMYDKNFFSFLAEHTEQINGRDKAVLQNIIERCCLIKSEIVSQDERENGIRAILNLGHTFAHGFESITDFAVPHGQCVALGTICAGYLSNLLGKMRSSELNELITLCEKLHFPDGIGYSDFNELYRYMQSDKKSMNGKLRFIVPESIGKVEIVDGITCEQVKLCCEKIRKGANA